jgi:hypothetical protein
MRAAVASLLVVHALLLAWLASVHSPLIDEPAHLASGLCHWRTFSFDLYRVNPPLVRAVAAVPLLTSRQAANWDAHSSNPYSRAEFSAGKALFETNDKAGRYLFAGRLLCIPFCILGGLVCFLWGNELFGRPAGLTALVLWSFSPMILAFGHTILPDVAAAAMGLSSCYVFWKWLKFPTPQRTFVAGAVLGVAELTKFTLLMLYPIFLTLWGIKVVAVRRAATEKDRPSFRLLLRLMLVSLLTINLGYGFEGSFVPLKDYEFISRTLCGDTKWNHETGFTLTGNRFRNHIVGATPVPLPYNYVTGIDVQKYDFEIGRNSYFMGEWSRKGWISYYVVGLFFKTPLAVTALGALSVCAFAASKKYRADLVSETALAAPIVTILCLASLQTKMNEHLRYAIPVLPFLFIGISRAAASAPNSSRALKGVAMTFVLLAALSSLLQLPHSAAYLNELVCSPGHSRAFTDKDPPPLLGSNIDWGQNLYFLQKWHDENQDKEPLYIDYAPGLPPERLGMQFVPPPMKRAAGYYAIGINELFSADGRHKDFQPRRPERLIANSIYIYRLTQEDVDAAPPKKAEEAQGVAKE